MIKWGIIGLGNIADKFASSLSHSKTGSLFAVASRDSIKSYNFAARHNCNLSYGNYEDLLNDENIDAIYIALPHGLHKEWSIKALNNKKAVLCEKPVTLTTSEMNEIKTTAILNNTFFMEAMKTRFLDANKELKKILDDKFIGDIVKIEANFCSNSNVPETSYLFDKDMGGVILDTGIYPLSFVMDMNRKNIIDITTTKTLTNNIDVSFSSTLTFEDNSTAEIEASFVCAKERKAKIYGTLGTIEIPNYNKANSFTIIRKDSPVISFNKDFDFDDFLPQIDEVNRCLNEGLKESPLMTLDESIRVMEVLDKIRLN